MSSRRSTILAALAPGLWVGGVLGGWTAALNRIPLASLDGAALALWFSALFAGAFAATAVLASGLLELLPGLRNGRAPRVLALLAPYAVPLLSALRWGAGGETRPWHVALAALGGLVAGAAGARAARRRTWPVVAALCWAVALALGVWLGQPESPRPRRSAAVRALSAGRPPVLLIGFDSLDPRLVDALVERGRLPSFAALRARGAWGELATLPYAVSPAVWTSVATGRTPSVHGIRWFTTTSPRGLDVSFQRWPRHLGLTPLVSGLHGAGLLTSRPVGSGMRRAPAVWTLLSRLGRTVTVVNWWCTFPAEPVSGALVSDRLFELSGHGADRHLTWPGPLAASLAELIVTPEDLPAAALEALIDGPVPAVRPRAGDFRTAFGRLTHAVASDESAMAVARRLSRRPAQLTAVYLRGVDLVSHGYAERSSLLAELDGWRAGDGPHAQTLVRYYERADAQLAELLSLAPPGSNALVVSDHGIAHAGAGRYEHLQSAPPGLLILAGPDVRPGVRLSGAGVLDVLPTLLYLLGLPPSEQMPGRILAEAFGVPGEGEPVARVDRYAVDAPAPGGLEGEADPTLRERLRSLGYVQ